MVDALSSELTRRTVRAEIMRAALSGPFQAFAQGGAVIMAVAVQHFAAPAAVKALLQAAPFLGNLLTPLVVQQVARRALPVSLANAVLLVLAGLGLLLACIGGLPWFVAGCVAGLMLVHANRPLIAALWRQNAADAERGRRFSRVVQVEIAAGALAALLIALWLRDHVAGYALVVAIAAICLVAAGFCAARVPSRPLPLAGRNPLAALAWLARDRAFAYVCGSWMIMGFANLMVQSLMAEYLVNPAHGLGYGTGLVLVLSAVIPQVVRVVASPIWGRIFDRVRFVPIRMALNLCFLVASLCFFSPWLPTQALGAVLMGLSYAGGDIAWNLWVTKYAPAERTADYMTVHVFLTGVRGIVAPFAAFHLIGGMPPPQVAWISAVLILAATAMLLREARLPRPG